MYQPMETVDETADFTDMMGQASVLNHANGNKGAWKQDPTKSLMFLWLFVLLVYWLTGFFFRRYLV